jgi:hypothetical protein
MNYNQFMEVRVATWPHDRANHMLPKTRISTAGGSLKNNLADVMSAFFCFDFETLGFRKVLTRANYYALGLYVSD